MVNKGEKLNSFSGYERGGRRKMNSYELQQLHTKTREDKTRAKHEQTKIRTITPNQQKQRIHIAKRTKRKICGNFGLWDLKKLIIRIQSHLWLLPKQKHMQQPRVAVY